RAPRGAGRSPAGRAAATPGDCRPRRGRGGGPAACPVPAGHFQPRRRATAAGATSCRGDRLRPCITPGRKPQPRRRSGVHGDDYRRLPPTLPTATRRDVVLVSPLGLPLMMPMHACLRVVLPALAVAGLLVACGRPDEVPAQLPYFEPGVQFSVEPAAGATCNNGAYRGVASWEVPPSLTSKVEI